MPYLSADCTPYAVHRYAVSRQHTMYEGYYSVGSQFGTNSTWNEAASTETRNATGMIWTNLLWAVVSTCLCFAASRMDLMMELGQSTTTEYSIGSSYGVSRRHGAEYVQSCTHNHNTDWNGMIPARFKNSRTCKVAVMVLQGQGMLLEGSCGIFVCKLPKGWNMDRSDNST